MSGTTKQGSPMSHLRGLAPCWALVRGNDLRVPGTAKALSRLGFALELITPTRVENARILGIVLGKKSFEPFELEDRVETDSAACRGGMNSDSSTLPFQGSIDIELVRGSSP